MRRGDNDWWPKFSKQEYERRYAALRQAMQDRGLDCLAVYGASIYFGTDPGSPNLAYLSAYAPALSGYVIFPREGAPTMAIYVASHRANARKLSVIDDVRAGADLPGILSTRIGELGLARGRIGIVGNFAWSNESVPWEHYEGLKKRLPDATIEVVTDWYQTHRMAKSEEETEFMLAGAAICDLGFDAFRAKAAPGVTDVGLHNEVLRVVHDQGGRIAFGHVGSTSMRDPEMIYPDFYSTNRVLQRGDALMTEMTAGYGGYFGKLYTTSFVGPPTAAYRSMFARAAESYRELLGAIRPGITGGDLPSAITRKAAPAGYKWLSSIAAWSTYNGRPVFFSRRVDTAVWDFELRPGHCMTVCGWIVSEDERMGVWVGAAIVVTEDGVRRLHRSPVDDLDANIFGG